MKMFWKVLLHIFSLLSILAGLPKLLQISQEVALFSGAGFGVAPLLLLGALQVAGGILSLIVRYRRLGLSLVIAGFMASVLVIIISGQLVFAAISMLPVLICMGLWMHERKAKNDI